MAVTRITSLTHWDACPLFFIVTTWFVSSLLGRGNERRSRDRAMVISSANFVLSGGRGWLDGSSAAIVFSGGWCWIDASDGDNCFVFVAKVLIRLWTAQFTFLNFSFCIISIWSCNLFRSSLSDRVVYLILCVANAPLWIAVICFLRDHCNMVFPYRHNSV